MGGSFFTKQVAENPRIYPWGVVNRGSLGWQWSSVSGTRRSLLKRRKIHKRYDWVNQQVKDLKLPTEELLILIKREDGSPIVPKGETWIQRGDIVVLASEK